MISKIVPLIYTNNDCSNPRLKSSIREIWPSIRPILLSMVNKQDDIFFCSSKSGTRIFIFKKSFGDILFEPVPVDNFSKFS